MRIVATVIAISFVVSSNVCAQVLLDGEIDLSEWSILDTSSQPTLRAWGPAKVELVDEALNIQSTEEIPLNSMPTVFDTGIVVSALDQSATDERFANGLFQATIRANTESNATLFMRGDTSTFSGYQFTGIGATNEFRIIRFVNGTGTNIGLMNNADDPRFSVGDNWIIEAGAINDTLSMKVWQEGQPEPELPQLVVTDDQISTGQIALGPAVSANLISQPTRLDVTYENLIFRAVPEPAASSLSFILPVAMLMHRRRKRHFQV